MNGIVASRISTRNAALLDQRIALPGRRRGGIGSAHRIPAPADCNRPAKIDTLASGYPHQVCNTPDEIGLELTHAPVDVGDVPHHPDDLAAAIIVESTIELTGEVV